jgi:hypothetical protein
MPSKSKAQQHLMGMAYGAKKKGKHLSGKAGKLESSMSMGSLLDYARTNPKGLPKKVKKGKKK